MSDGRTAGPLRCFESFPAVECKEEGGADRVPRALPCPKLHTYCTECLERMVKCEVDENGKTRIFVLCSLCRFEHELHPQQPIASSATAAAAAAGGAAASEPTDAELVRLIPINASLMDAVGRGRQLERMVRETQRQLQDCGGATRCTYPGCAQPALFWCDECEGELCATHDRDLHPAAAAPAAAAASSSASHRRIPLSERTSARHAKMAARLAANGAQLRTCFLDAEERNTKRAAILSAKLEAETARVEREVLEPIRAEIALQSKADLAFQKLSAKVASLSDVDLHQCETLIRQIITASGPVLDGLLAELSPERRSDLERFLQTAGVSLDQTLRLLYRATRDGFRKEDFVRQCAGRSGTLTLIKIKGNNYLFGAYTHCAWPSVNGVVADPTGQSFLFSLVNATGKAVRFSLRGKERAVELSATGLHFGANRMNAEGRKQTVWPNVSIMSECQATSQKSANAANLISDTKAYQPDDDNVRDITLFTGNFYFDASQIEVFQL